MSLFCLIIGQAVLSCDKTKGNKTNIAKNHRKKFNVIGGITPINTLDINMFPAQKALVIINPTSAIEFDEKNKISPTKLLFQQATSTIYANHQIIRHCF